MATVTRRLLPALLKTRRLSTEKSVAADAVVGSHTTKWMQVGICPLLYGV
jgi:hypothetical protein